MRSDSWRSNGSLETFFEMATSPWSRYLLWFVNIFRDCCIHIDLLLHMRNP